MIEKKADFSNIKKVNKDIYEHMITDSQKSIDFQNNYINAIKEVCTKLRILNSEYQLKNKRSLIHHIESRLKTPGSIVTKLIKKGFEPSLESAQKHLTDIAGVRVICNYIEDIYMIYNILQEQKEYTFIKVRDYIQNPKPNGYRSLHIVINVPASSGHTKMFIPTEIQIRTIAMDYWSSLEHQIRYKKNKNVPEDLFTRLKNCADLISEIDTEMQNINKELQSLDD